MSLKNILFNNYYKVYPRKYEMVKYFIFIRFYYLTVLICIRI